MDEMLKKMLDDMDATVRVGKTFYLYCKVKPQARQSIRRGQTSFFVPKKKKEYMKKLRDVFWPQYGLRNPPLTTLVKLVIIFAFPWPKTRKTRNRFFGWEFCTKRQDLDNSLKIHLDSMSGLIFKDDSQVVVLQAMKIYAREACVAVKISEISEKF